MITVHTGASSHHHPDTPHVIKPQQSPRQSQPNPSRSWNGRGGEPRAIYDVMGKEAILFHHTTTDDDTSTGSQYVEQARTWFDSVWTTIATEFTR